MFTMPLENPNITNAERIAILDAAASKLKDKEEKANTQISKGIETIRERIRNGEVIALKEGFTEAESDWIHQIISNSTKDNSIPKTIGLPSEDGEIIFGQEKILLTRLNLYQRLVYGKLPSFKLFFQK